MIHTRLLFAFLNLFYLIASVSSNVLLAHELSYDPTQALCGALLSTQVEIFSVRDPARGKIPLFPRNIQKIYVPNFEKTIFEDLKLAISNLQREYPDREISAYLPVRKYRHEEVERILHFFQDAGIRELVILAGGKFADAEQKGAFRDSASFLKKVDLARYGIREIGVAGHPEHNPYMTFQERMEALRTKYKLARDQGLGMRILTNVVSRPSKFAQWTQAVREMGIVSKIYYGIAIPEMKDAEYKRFTIDLCQAVCVDPTHPDYDEESLRRLTAAAENDIAKVHRELSGLDAHPDGFHFYLYGENSQAGLNTLAR